MSKGNQLIERHPVEPEELMAYLDGELPLDRAATAAAHLERCRECQSVAGDLQSVSRRLMVWQVESGKDSAIPPQVVAALEAPTPKNAATPEQLSWRDVVRRRWKPVWIGGLAVAGFALLMMVLTPNPMRWSKAPMTDAPAARGVYGEGRGTVGKLIMPSQQDKSEMQSAAIEPSSRIGLANEQPERERQGGGGGGRARSESSLPKGPMIVRTAGLTLITKEFERARAEVEQILKRHGGYVGQLNVSAPANSGRTLTATLRIPAAQLDAALAELKKLGRVENESQSGEEVTQRYVDLQARLANSRHTEQQLTDILRNRTGKLSDVLEVEQELDRVRGEIEQMEAERKNLAHQVDFATLNTTLTEEYETQLQAVPVSTSTRLRNAAVEGYASMVDGIVSVILFLFSYGPSLLLWAAVLFFPARAVWRRWRTSTT